MKFKSVAVPGSISGIKIPGKREVVPNQSMSIRQILDRFTRGEKLPIGKDGSYFEGPEDLEKAAHKDLTEKEEFIDRQMAIRERFEEQQAARKKALSDHAMAEAKAEAAKKLAEEAAKAK